MKFGHTRKSVPVFWTTLYGDVCTHVNHIIDQAESSGVERWAKNWRQISLRWRVFKIL